MRDVRLAVLATAVVLAGQVAAADVTETDVTETTAQPDVPLRERIDRLVEAGAAKAEPRPATLAPLADDAEFVRRAFLTLTGRIPGITTARRFLGTCIAPSVSATVSGDHSPPNLERRAELVDRLLASPEHARHLMYFLDTYLMERRADKHVKEADWRDYLLVAVRANRPLNLIAREILTADGAEKAPRAAAKFYLDREGELHRVTRDVGRLFLGVNLQCAQCHDHPAIEGYPQSSYYGVYAFLNRSFLFNDKKKKQVFFAEKATGEVSYKNVFEPDTSLASAPRLPGLESLAEPKFEKGKEYQVAPAKGVRPVPKYSRRSALARAMTDGSNVLFNRNMANRLWAWVMGRGIVEPLDFHHADNPPSHPELLELLGSELAAMNYDIRRFLRELVLTRTFQRSSVPSSPTAPVVASDDTRTAEATADADADGPRFAVATLRPLTPEQLAWSYMVATGVLETTRPQVIAELRKAAAKKKGEAKKGDKKDAVAKADTKLEPPSAERIEAALAAKLNDRVKWFVTFFGHLPGEPSDEFQPSVQQALALKNSDVLHGWIASGALLARLERATDAQVLADELFLSVLTRPPSAAERTWIAANVPLDRNAANRRTTLQSLVWALLASAEFRFNH